MELFQALGEEIENLWRERDYNEEIFPQIAADALERGGVPSKVTAWDVMEWTLAQDRLPRQKDPGASFGQPPITLFAGPRFYIDVYFWLEGTTTIHQHGFCGAFQVLLGSSIHSWYRFEQHDAVNVYTAIGDITLKQCHLLNTGDIQQIRAGEEYIHSLFHLDYPSATIVVRTGDSPLHLPQYQYLKPGLRLDPFFFEEMSTKKVQAISSLFRVNYADTDRLTSELLERSDFHTTFQVLSAVHREIGSKQIDRLFNIDVSKDRFGKFLDVAVRRHGERARILGDVFAHAELVKEIGQRRGYVTDPELRFFLALLLNIEGKDRIFALVKERFPEADPLDKVLDWTYALAQTRVMGVNIPNALGIEGFDDGDLVIFEYLLDGKSRDEIETELKKQNAENVLRDLDARLQKIETAVIFQPLFADAG